MQSLMDRVARHWVMTLVGFFGGLASIAGLIVVFWWPSAPPESPPPLPPVMQRVTPDPDLAIMDADLDPVVRTRRLFGMIPVGSDYLLSYRIAIRNAERKARTGCRIATEYAGPAVEGSGLLYVGPWVDWYQGKGTGLYFDLPPDPAFLHQFFAVPSPENLWPLERVRARILCEKPDFQLSPWYELDLTRIEWR